jgi:hypothetical protein
MSFIKTSGESADKARSVGAAKILEFRLLFHMQRLSL